MSKEKEVKKVKVIPLIDLNFGSFPMPITLFYAGKEVVVERNEVIDDYIKQGLMKVK